MSFVVKTKLWLHTVTTVCVCVCVDVGVYMCVFNISLSLEKSPSNVGVIPRGTLTYFKIYAAFLLNMIIVILHTNIDHPLFYTTATTLL